MTDANELMEDHLTELERLESGSVKRALSLREVLETFPDVLPSLRESYAVLQEEEQERQLNIRRRKERIRRLTTDPDSIRFAFSILENLTFPEDPALERIGKWIERFTRDHSKKLDIEAAKDSMSIVELASMFREVDDQGQKARCMCPFHNDHAPSLVLYKRNNTFHCFACGADGDIIALTMKLKDIDFIRAAKFLMSYGKSSEANTGNPRT